MVVISFGLYAISKSHFWFPKSLTRFIALPSGYRTSSVFYSLQRMYRSFWPIVTFFKAIFSISFSERDGGWWQRCQSVGGKLYICFGASSSSFVELPTLSSVSTEPSTKSSICSGAQFRHFSIIFFLTTRKQNLSSTVLIRYRYLVCFFLEKLWILEMTIPKCRWTRTFEWQFAICSTILLFFWPWKSLNPEKQEW